MSHTKGITSLSAELVESVKKQQFDKIGDIGKRCVDILR